MDKNQATGLMLIALMLMTYFIFFSPETPIEESAEPAKEISALPDSTAMSAPDSVVTNDSLVSVENRQKYGAFASGAAGNGQTVSMENELISVSFNSKGGMVSAVTLKNFESIYADHVKLITPESNNFSLNTSSQGKNINLNELYYHVDQSSSSTQQTTTFTLNLENGGKVIHTYILDAGYELLYKLEFKGLDGQISKDEVILQWNDNMITQEKDVEISRQNSTVNFYTLTGDFDELTERSNDYQEEVVDEPLKWMTFKQRFFLAAIIADKQFNKGKFTSQADLSNPEVVKSATATLSIPTSDIQNGGANFRFYFGPNDYHITKEVSEDFSKNLFLGWPPMIWVNKIVLIPLFDILNNFLSNYGVIIILMVLIIKLVLSPLSYKSYVSMAKMKVLKPELDEIKEKHDGDMAKAQQEQMKLYQQVGVNPISGCIPMLLQMPILLAMFYFFPQSIELRGESFLWAEDLSTYDSIIDLPFTIPFYGNHVSLFVLLMTTSSVLMAYSQQQVSSVQGPMKSIGYVMPVMFMFILNSYPAALSFYYFVSNLVTFGQQTLIRKFVDDDKIREKLEEHKKNAGNKKTSKFQQRLQDAMKAQTENQKKKK